MQRINVTELAGTTITRARGEEAFGTLARLLEGGPAEIELDRAEMLSASFLDEIVRQLAAQGRSELVTFITDNSNTLDKLARIAANREAKIYARGALETHRRVVEPRRIEVRATFQREKVEA